MTIQKFYPTSFTNTLAKATITNPTYAYQDDGLYAELSDSNRNNTATIRYGSFDFSAIPANSAINSASFEVELRFSTTGTSDWVKLRAFNGTTQMGTVHTILTEPLTDTVFTDTDIGTWTLATLPNIQVELEWDRGNSNTASTIYIDYFAVIVDYTPPAVAQVDVPLVVSVSGLMTPPVSITGTALVDPNTMVSGASLNVPTVVIPISLTTPQIGTINGLMLIPTVAGNANVDSISMESQASFEPPLQIILASIDIPKVGAVTGELKIPGVSGTAQVTLQTTPTASANIETPDLETANILGIPESEVIAQAYQPNVFIRYDIIIQPTASQALANMLVPVREATIKLMTLDELLNLVVKGEVVEGAVVNLDELGVLTVTEIIEGSAFNLSSTGVLTVNTVTEEGVEVLPSYPQILDESILWLDASDEVTITKDGSNLVSNWNDKSGNNNDAYSETGGSSPLYTTDVNGKSMLRFDGVDDRLIIANSESIDIIDAVSIFAIVIPQNVQEVASSKYEGIFSKGTAANRQYWLWQVKTTDLVSGQIGSNNIYAGGVSAPFIQGVNSVFSLIGSTSENWQELWHNGVMIANATTTSVSKQESPLYLGYMDSYNYFNGDYAEVIIYNRALTATERQEVEQYLIDKWGV